MKITKRTTANSLVVVGIVSLSLWLVSIPTDTWLSSIGSKNVYLFMYLIAFVGSITTFASIPYPLFLVSFAAAGFNPILLGLASASGVIMADTGTFFAAKRGRQLLSDKLKSSFAVVSSYVEQYPKFLKPGLVLYGTFSPLSNDFAVLTLALMKYSYWRTIPYLAIGNLIYNIGIALLGVYAYEWIVAVF